MLRITALWILLASVVVQNVNAQNDFYWNDSSGGFFLNGSNWDPGGQGPNDSADNAHFDLGQSFLNTYSVMHVNGTNNQLVVENDSVLLEIVNYETSSGTGDATITGTGSLWEIHGELSIGGNAETGTNGGPANLVIEAGGAITVDNETVLFPAATVNLDGGTLTTPAIQFSGGGEFNFSGGTLHVETYDGELINQGGTLAPGQAAGSTTVFGNYVQSNNANLQIEIGGPIPGSEHDFVNVAEDAVLDGQLELALVAGFVPTAGQTFTVLNAGQIFGFFNNVGDNQRLDSADGLGSFLVRYGATSPNPNQIVLSDFQTSFILGDINGDGSVDLLDVAPFVVVTTSGEYLPAADIDMDGAVTLLDVAPFVALLAG